MRQSYSDQLRLDTVAVHEVELNLESRDRMVPILRALQHVYSNRHLADQVLRLIGDDISDGKRTDTGRKGMDYWHICVLAAARLGCDFTYDQLQDLAENHRNLRAIMGLGDCDEKEFHGKTIRNNICLLKPTTIEKISQVIVGAGHTLQPEAISKVRADSFVMNTCIHYPTESSLLYDGLRKIILMCVVLAEEQGVSGWRQHEHLLNKLKKLNRKINRIASRKGPRYKARMKPFYRELLQKAALLTQRARDLCAVIGQPSPQVGDTFGPNALSTLQRGE